MKKKDNYSAKYMLRDIVLQHGGAMSINQLLGFPKLRHCFERGCDSLKIRNAVTRLNHELRGTIGPYGEEAWIVFKNVVIGLESRIDETVRQAYSERRHKDQIGRAKYTLTDNELLAAKIEADKIRQKAKSSSKSITGMTKSSRDLIDAIEETR